MQEPERDPMTTIAAVLSRLETNQGHIRSGVEGVEKELKIQNGRISLLEKWQQRILGAAVLLGLMSPLFVLGIRESIAELFK